eukprot:TRINITY_DN10395_c0_g4_i1.p1 TRINITY_DN10395_c0_g4~~TRINITY_DN10395_c0_g4_i1.p1  ORF type:complete len:229 (+),score=45.65 TRINITY_DN10395_c0_g4_i1:745-1431(+)
MDALRDQTRNIPPFNKEAENVEDIYDIHGIISTEEWDLMEFKDLLTTAKKPGKIKELADAKTFPFFVTQILGTHVSAEKDRSVRIHGVKCLMYAAWLLKFARCAKGKLANDEEYVEYMDAPEEICISIRNRFAVCKKTKTGRVSYDRTPMLKDKLITYMAVLLLTATKFKMDPGLLASEFKITALKSLNYFKEVGCKSERVKTGSNSGYLVRLTAPLTFPAKPRVQRK